MAEATEVTYRYLEPRPHSWRKQLWIKGRNMTVWQLLCYMWGAEMTPEEVAKDLDLPVEAVYEALDYYQRYRDIIIADAEEEKRWLKEHGVSL